MKITPILQIGKSSVTPELISAVDEALERTRSEVVQVIGKKVVLYRESKDNKKIELPKPSKKA